MRRNTMGEQSAAQLLYYKYHETIADVKKKIKKYFLIDRKSQQWYFRSTRGEELIGVANIGNQINVNKHTEQTNLNKQKGLLLLYINTKNI